MKNSIYRNALIAAGIAAALSISVTGCGKTASDRVAATPKSPTVAEAAKATGETVKETGDTAAQAMSDTWITTKVKSVLLADSDAQGFDVKVDTKDGVVTLEGTLATQEAVDHVKMLAADVEGVERVESAALTVAYR
jgi:hyperosmotically inducible periplasmic protein